jgi:CO/xanthine dehydrogenase FAD-binding subunit
MSLRPLYARPRTVTEAGAVLSGIRSGAVVVAGGQEIMPHINYGRLMPTAVVDIGSIAELRGIAMDGSELTIGALATHRDIRRNDLVARHAPLLSAGAAEVGGGWQVHNRGTIGGNLTSMHPLYDIAPALLALKAEVEIHGDGGARRIALAKVMSDTAHGLGSRTILTRIRVRPAAGGWAYRKLKATAGAYGSANAAVQVSLNKGTITALTVVIGAASALPIDASSALAHLIGRPWDTRAADEAEAACAALIKEPLSDQQGDGAWRRAMAGVMARRAAADAIARATAA